MVVKTADELLDLVTRALTAAGAGDSHAAEVAEHLVAASLRGVDTHGVYQITRYLPDVTAGRIDPTAEPEVRREAAAHALVSGRWTFGHVAAKRAMRVAIDKSQAQGLALVSLVESTHIGRVGHYVEMASAAGQIAMVFGGGYCRNAPRAVPFGGSRGALDTNPVAMAFAGPDPTAPVMFDFATTTAAGGKVDIACRRQQPMPPGWVVDKQGRPTTEPADFTDGGYFVPFGAHKGYALMLAAEVLGSVFSGADAYAATGPDYPMFQHQGVTMIVMRADLFQPIEQFTASLHNREQAIRQVPPAPVEEQGPGEVFVPGDPERTTRAERTRDGIPIHADDWRAMVSAAAAVGCRFE